MVWLGLWDINHWRWFDSKFGLYTYIYYIYMIWFGRVYDISTIVGYLMPNTYILCHVVSHWEDINKITTIVLFELTVTSHQRMTVKNRCLYLVTSLGSPDTGRKKVEAKRLAGTLKTEVAPSSRQRKKEKLVVGQGSWWTDPKAKYSG